MSKKDTNAMEASYQKAGIGGSIGFGKRPAIVVVDFQKAFTHAESPLGVDMEAACRQTRKLIMAAREKNLKVFYTRLGYGKDGADLNVLGKKCTNYKLITRNSWLYELDERLDVRDEDVVLEVHAQSVFFNTPLNQILKPIYVDTLIMCGGPVAGPLYTSAVDACSNGYRLIVPTDAVADYTAELADTFLWNINMKYGDLSTVDDCIAEIAKLKPLKYDFLGDYYQMLSV